MRNFKLFITLAITLILATLFTSCGNMSIGPGNYSFRHVRISDHTTGYCATIEKWHDNELGIEIKTKEYGDIYASEGSYILFSDANKCPYCN